MTLFSDTIDRSELIRSLAPTEALFQECKNSIHNAKLSELRKSEQATLRIAFAILRLEYEENIESWIEEKIITPSVRELTNSFEEIDLRKTDAILTKLKALPEVQQLCNPEKICSIAKKIEPKRPEEIGRIAIAGMLEWLKEEGASTDELEFFIERYPFINERIKEQLIYKLYQKHKAFDPLKKGIIAYALNSMGHIEDDIIAQAYFRLLYHDVMERFYIKEVIPETLKLLKQHHSLSVSALEKILEKGDSTGQFSSLPEEALKPLDIKFTPSYIHLKLECKPDLEVNPLAMAQTMREMGVDEARIKAYLSDTVDSHL